MFVINAAPVLEVAFVTSVKRFCANFTVEDPKNESRMPPAHLWSIKIENGKACIYLDGEKLKQHKNMKKYCVWRNQRSKERMPCWKEPTFQTIQFFFSNSPHDVRSFA